MNAAPGRPPTSNADYLRALRRVNEGPTAPADWQGSGPGKPGAERRRNPRYKCEGSAEFRAEGSDVRTWATVTDISCNGCYVEMHATSPVNTTVNMMIEVNGKRVRARGVVRISYPYLGMGIAFTEVPEQDRAQLDELLRALAGGDPVPAPEAKSAPHGPGNLLMVTDPASALNAVAGFFQSRSTMSRDEFQELIGRSQERTPGTHR